MIALKRKKEQPSIMSVLEFRGGIRSLLSSHKTADWQAKLLSYDYATATPEAQLQCSCELRKDLAASR